MAEDNTIRVKLTLDGKEYTVNMDKAGGEADAFASKISGHNESIRKGALIAGAAAVAAGGLALKASADYETAFVQVSQAVNGTAQELEGLKEGLLDMAAGTKGTAADLTEIAAAAGDLQVQAPNILEFTKNMADFGAAAGITGQEAVAALGALAKATGTLGEDADNLGSSIVGIGDALQVSESKVLSMANALAVTGRSVGLTNTQIVGLSGAMIKAGLDSESGGQVISQTFAAMAKAIQEGSGAVVDNTEKIAEGEEEIRKLSAALEIAAQKQSEFTDKTSASTRMAQAEKIREITVALEEQRQEVVDLTAEHGKMGDTTALDAFAAAAKMTGEEFKEAFEKDAAGAMQAFLAGVKAAGPEAVSVLDSVGLAGGRTRAGLLAAAEGAEAIPGAMDAATKAFKENTATTNSANQAYETAAARSERVRDTFSELSVKVGDALIPALNGLLAVLVPVLDFLTEHSTIVAVLIVSVGALAAAVWAVTFAQQVNATMTALAAGRTVAFSAATVVATAITWAQSIATGAATAAQWLLNAAMYANPIGLIILAVVALIAILWLIVSNWDAISSWLMGAWEATKQFFVNIWNGIVEFFAGIWKRMIGFIDSFVGFFQGIWGGVVTAFKVVWGAIAGFFSGLWDGIVGTVKIAINLIIAILNTVPKAINWMIDQVNGISFDLPDYLGGAHVGFSIPKIPLIPSLDVGGSILEDGLAMLHKGEVVVPAAEVSSPYGGGRGGGMTVIFQATIQSAGPDYDSRELFEEFAGMLRDSKVLPT